MANSPRPVEIIGGGLAGLALGTGLRRRGIPVTIREAGTYPRHRVCGEFITGLAPATLDELALGGVLDDALEARSVAWFDRRGQFLRRTLPAPARCLSRHRLDGRLAANFTEAGGDLRTGERPPPDPSEGRVLACGRRPDPRSRLVGLKQHFHGLPLAADLEMHLGRGAYVGLTRVEGGAVNVCGLFRRERGPGGLAAAVAGGGLSALADRLAGATPLPGSACAVSALAYRGTPSAGLVLGDRAGLIPPFTGHGMAIAIQGAAAVLPALERWAGGLLDWSGALAAARSALRNRVGRKTSLARLLHPFLLEPSGQFLLRQGARAGLLPFDTLFRLVH